MTLGTRSSSFVGYIRVSTSRQEEEGFSLGTQERVIQSWAHEARKVTDWIFSDAGTARGTGSYVPRIGLRDAIKQALELGVPLVVPNISRLSRDLSVLKEIERSGVEVISIQDANRKLTKAVLRSLVQRAEADGKNIAERARRAARNAKSRGVPLGNRTNLPEAQRRGSISNIVRADTKTKELADFLGRTPGWEEMKRKDLVDLLNKSGPLNLISQRRAEREMWRVSTLRKPLLRAIEEMALRSDDDETDALFSSDIGTAAGSVSSAETDKMSETEKRRKQLAEDFKDHPTFGVF